MRRGSRARALLLVLALIATGCSESRRTVDRATAGGRCSLTATERTLLVAAGSSSNNASLFRVDLCSRTAHRLADTHRTSVVSAGGGFVVVANARGGPDALYQLKDDRLVPLPGIGSPMGMAPSVAPDGRVSYVALGPTSASAYQLHVWTPPRGESAATDEVVFGSGQDAPALISSWTPDGRLLLALSRERAGRPAGRSRMLVMTSGGQVRRSVALTSRLVSQFLWTPHQTVIVAETDATGAQRSGSVLRTSDFRPVGSTPKGWTVLAVSPSGRLILLTRQGRLGLADATARSPIVRQVQGISLGQVVSGTWS